MNKELILKTFDDICKHVSLDNVSKYMRGHFPKEYSELLTATSFLDKFGVPDDKNKKISILERIYCLRHDFVDRPKCKNCGREYVCGFNKQKQEYRKWCSARCQASDPECIAESKATRLSKYGNETYHGVEKAKTTRMAKNGGKWHADDFGDKVKAGKARHGHGANWVNAEKAKETKSKKYGSASFNNKEKNKITRKTNFYRLLAKNASIEPMFTLGEYLAGDKRTPFSWKCRKCGHVFTSRFNYNFKCGGSPDGNYARCPACFPRKIVKTSAYEQELLEFIKEFAPDAVQSDRTAIYPYELDVYSPEAKIAVEFDGLYWHSDENKPNDYHLNKTELCEKAGIKLIHVFEDEWIEKRDIVESRLKTVFGKYGSSIFARKCEISAVDAPTAREFLNANHLQGAVNSSVRLGLYYEKELVALMTFGKCRFDKKHEWEMLRFCNRLNTRIVGGAGKLLAHFERIYGPKSLISYADKRWSRGNLYNALGFTRLKDSKPCYYYVNGSSRFSRMRFQKHKLKGVLENFDPRKSEYENMKANGYYRIYDCGNLVFEKTYPENEKAG